MSRKRAVVTGAAVRVGRAVALELASAGFDVAVHYNRSEAPAERTAAECRETGADAWTVQGDLGTLSLGAFPRLNPPRETPDAVLYE